MTTTFKKALLAAFAITSIAGVSTLAIAEPAVTQTATNTYSYDSNKDGFIGPDEFTTYFYTRSDLDGDGYMGDEEWNTTTAQWYRPYKDVDYNTYTYWDQDKDERLDSNEVKTLIEKTGLYSKWDINEDGKLSNSEFEKGTFAAYDDNGDGVLSLTEWKSVLR